MAPSGAKQNCRGAQAPGSMRNPQSKPRQGPVLAFICVDLCPSVVKRRGLELIHQVAVAPSLAAGAGAGVRLTPIGTPFVGLPDRIAGPAHGPACRSSVAIRVYRCSSVDTCRRQLPWPFAFEWLMWPLCGGGRFIESAPWVAGVIGRRPRIQAPARARVVPVAAGFPLVGGRRRGVLALRLLRG